MSAGALAVRLWRPVLTVALLLWTAFVLAAFYVVQRPIAPDEVQQIADGLSAWADPPTFGALTATALNLAATAVITAAAVATGTLLTARANLPQARSAADRAERWLLGAGLGFGLIALAVFVLALAGSAQREVLVGLCAVLLAIGVMPTLRTLRDDLPVFARVRLPLPLVLLATLSLIVSLLLALSPPTAWDGLVYHLTVAQRAAAQGRLAPQGDIVPQENFPLLMSALYLLGMQLRGDIAAQCIHWVFEALCIALVGLAACRQYGRRAAWYALALSLSMPALLLLGSWAYNDLALAFYIVACAYAYQRWASTRNEGYFVISACMAGFALGLKYTAFVLPVGVASLIVWDLRKAALRPLVRYAMVCALVAGAWYVKNLVFTGNPVYPFAFGGAYWDNLRTFWYERPGTGIGLDLWTILTLPVTITLGYRDANYVDGRVGPLALVALPLLVLNRPRLSRYLVLAGIFFGFWVWGIIGTASLWQSRLLLPALLLLIPGLGAAVVELERYDHPRLSLYQLLKLVIALVLCVTFFSQLAGLVETNPIAFLAGAETRQQFLQRQIGPWTDAMAALQTLPAAARVQFLWEPRSYLAGRPVRADPLLDALPHLTATQGGLPGAIRALKAEGYTHVLVYEVGAELIMRTLPDLYSTQDKQNLLDLENRYARTVFENRFYRLLELK